MKAKPAFTLIEVVVSVGVFSLLAVMGSSLLFTILRGSKKTESVAVVEAEGRKVLESMSNHLRFAKRVTNCSDRRIDFVNVDNRLQNFVCQIGAESDNTYVASTGARLTSPSVVVTDCRFVCKPDLPDTNSVEISLTLQKFGAPPQDKATVTVNTRVQLRNR